MAETALASEREPRGKGKPKGKASLMLSARTKTCLKYGIILGMFNVVQPLYNVNVNEININFYHWCSFNVNIPRSCIVQGNQIWEPGIEVPCWLYWTVDIGNHNIILYI